MMRPVSEHILKWITEWDNFEEKKSRNEWATPIFTGKKIKLTQCKFLLMIDVFMSISHNQLRKNGASGNLAESTEQNKKFKMGMRSRENASFCQNVGVAQNLKEKE